MTLSRTELDFLEQAYGWAVLEVATLHEGENETYAVTTTTGKVSLRRYRSGRYTPAEVNAELEWLAALEGSVPVVPALHTRNGERCVVQQEENPEVYVAFPYITGDEPDPPTPRDFRRLGRLLGQLHDAAARVLETKSELWAGYRRPTYDLRVVESGLESLLHTSLLDRTDKARCVALAEQLKELYNACEPRKSFVHADLHFGNVLVKGDVWTLLDFDECGFGFPAFDLGTVRFHARATEQTEGWQVFLSGYGEPLPTAPELKLGTAMKIFYTAGKLPFRLDIPEVQNRAAELIPEYLTIVERELADT